MNNAVMPQIVNDTPQVKAAGKVLHQLHRWKVVGNRSRFDGNAAIFQLVTRRDRHALSLAEVFP
jgi:hypothetical protein